MSGLSGRDFQALANLLTEEKSSSSEDDLPNPGLSKLGPGDIQATKKPTRSRIKGNVNAGQLKSEGDGDNRFPRDPDDIWHLDEVDVISRGEDSINDPRFTPQVDIAYSQSVKSEDIYLQMGNKTPLTSSCELMAVNVTMKGEIMDKVDCNVTDEILDIRSPLYRLHLPLPHRVKSDTAKAEWNSATSQLTVTLEIVREFDI